MVNVEQEKLLSVTWTYQARRRAGSRIAFKITTELESINVIINKSLSIKLQGSRASEKDHWIMQTRRKISLYRHIIGEGSCEVLPRSGRD